MYYVAYYLDKYDVSYILMHLIHSNYIVNYDPPCTSSVALSSPRWKGSFEA